VSSAVQNLETLLAFLWGMIVWVANRLDLRQAADVYSAAGLDL